MANVLVEDFIPHRIQVVENVSSLKKRMMRVSIPPK
jgi:hypothetical protein